jgi:hypothetical protein
MLPDAPSFGSRDSSAAIYVEGFAESAGRCHHDRRGADQGPPGSGGVGKCGADVDRVAGRDTPAGHYERNLTKVSEVRLRVPKLRQETFEMAIVERSSATQLGRRSPD